MERKYKHHYRVKVELVVSIFSTKPVNVREEIEENIKQITNNAYRVDRITTIAETHEE